MLRYIFYISTIIFLVISGLLQYAAFNRLGSLHALMETSNGASHARQSLAIPHQTPQPRPQLQAAPTLSEATIRRVIRAELDDAANRDAGTQPEKRVAATTPAPTKSPEEFANLRRQLDATLRDISLAGRFDAGNSFAFDQILAELPPDERNRALAKLSGTLSSGSVP